jgi:uncharacterized sulfatase
MTRSRTTRRIFLRTTLAGAALGLSRLSTPAGARDKPPNILLAIADDWSWPLSSSAGCKFVRTPNFDRIAREGVLFPHAYVASPSCTPSRGSLLTGQWFWRLEEGANLFGDLRPKFEVYPDLLEQAGYQVGVTGKGWGPGDWKQSGRTRNPAGPEYNQRQTSPTTGAISRIDYAGNFEEFLQRRDPAKPFCFWYGGNEPHRPYEYKSGVRAGKRLEDVEVPACFPDSEEVRTDLLDYALEVEYFDSHLGQMIRKLEEIGELDHTVIVVTGDNGLPFPRCKGNLYDLGTNVPLAIRWGDWIKGGRVVEDFVSLCDLAPTFLEAADLEPTDQMTGRSVLALLTSGKSGWIDPERGHILTGRERHTEAQPAPSQAGYPMRAIRTRDFLYVRNFKPERYPAGLEGRAGSGGPIAAGVDARIKLAFWPFKDIDVPSPTKQYMMDHRDDPEVKPLFKLAFERRPAEELYDLRKDPNQLKNVAADPAYGKVKSALASKLLAELRATADPRVLGGGDKFDAY